MILTVFTGIHRRKAQGCRLPRHQFQGQGSLEERSSKIRRDYDILYGSFSSHLLCCNNISPDSGLESIHRKEWKGWTRNDGLVKEDSVIHSIYYHRLILDEAHSIKVSSFGHASGIVLLT